MMTDESKQSQKRAKRAPRSQQSLNDSDAQTDGQTSGTSMTGRQLDGARKDSGFQRFAASEMRAINRYGFIMLHKVNALTTGRV